VKELQMSDYSPGGLQFIRDNLKLNQVDATVTVAKLDWTDVSLSDAALQGFDGVFIADCWYDYEMVEVLTALVKRLVLLNKCAFFNATAIRNLKTYELYHTAMLHAGFTVQALETPSESLFPYESEARYAVKLERYELP
jgi:hypothetical protein